MGYGCILYVVMHAQKPQVHTAELMYEIILLWYVATQEAL